MNTSIQFGDFSASHVADYQRVSCLITMANIGKSPFSMGKSTISMENHHVEGIITSVPEGKTIGFGGPVPGISTQAASHCSGCSGSEIDSAGDTSDGVR